jgi:formylglycine-generating enzyme required for sulfatase activity
MTFIQIPAGTFEMGSENFAAQGRRATRLQRAEQGRHDEYPAHDVTITRAFYLGKYEVTQAQWQAVMGSHDNPSATKDPSHPVENVSWDDAQRFIQRLNAKEGTTRYRLPTEAEWEYATRAGTTTAYSFGHYKAFKPYACIAYAGRNKVCSVGQENCDNTKFERWTCTVGARHPNPWGLYDMHGNVAEWVQDWYDANYYAVSPKQDPRGPEAGKDRVYRGGSWHNSIKGLRSAVRFHRQPDFRDPRIGFRVAFTADKARLHQ